RRYNPRAFAFVRHPHHCRTTGNRRSPTAKRGNSGKRRVLKGVGFGTLMRQKTKEIRTANSPHGDEAAARVAARRKLSVGQALIASFLSGEKRIREGNKTYAQSS